MCQMVDVLSYLDKICIVNPMAVNNLCGSSLNTWSPLTLMNSLSSHSFFPYTLLFLSCIHYIIPLYTQTGHISCVQYSTPTVHNAAFYSVKITSLHPSPSLKYSDKETVQSSLILCLIHKYQQIAPYLSQIIQSGRRHTSSFYCTRKKKFMFNCQEISLQYSTMWTAHMHPRTKPW